MPHGRRGLAHTRAHATLPHSCLAAACVRLALLTPTSGQATALKMNNQAILPVRTTLTIATAQSSESYTACPKILYRGTVVASAAPRAASLAK